MYSRFIFRKYFFNVNFGIILLFVYFIFASNISCVVSIIIRIDKEALLLMYVIYCARRSFVTKKYFF